MLEVELERTGGADELVYRCVVVHAKYDLDGCWPAVLVGAVGGATQSFVSGSILAQAPGIGVGGTVNIQNTSANAPLNIDFAGIWSDICQ